MEIRYVVEQTNTKEFYLDWASKATRKRVSYKAAIVIYFELPLLIAIWFFITGNVIPAVAFLFLAILLPFWFKNRLEKSMNRVWNTNKVFQNIITQIKFYDTYLEMTSEQSNSKYEYNKLYKICELDNAIWIMVGINQGIAFEKKNCPEGLITFLKEKTDGIVKWF